MNKIIKISLVASALFFFGCSGENPTIPDSRLDKAEKVLSGESVEASDNADEKDDDNKKDEKDCIENPMSCLEDFLK